ncbi:hypothetical protein J5N97_006235 [Dioscorea zingiberensis]|uniref:Uncharacterized protein n=1 Tax=Dioscorea zingiberensis TaxID=325984 RepID=A0A9D5DB38_9LILI|nr:hypothetical protein J5N97_006235 [Dioscorea zingiberensis]
MRESDFSGCSFNSAYLEKAVAYKANFSGADLSDTLMDRMDHLQIFNIEAKAKIKSHQMREHTRHAEAQLQGNQQIHKTRKQLERRRQRSKDGVKSGYSGKAGLAKVFT